MSDLTPFIYGDQPVRVVNIDSEPWFVLADLLSVLGFARSASAVSERLDDGVRQTYPILDSLGRTQNATIVSEAGMYEVVIRSDKPEAVAFRRWITAEVLPAIRKTGGYGVQQLSGPALMAAALQEADRTMRALESTVSEHRAQLRLVQPKADAFDRWMGSGAEYSLDVAAKLLSASGYLTGQNRLFKELSEIGWAYKGADGWRPYQQHGPEGAKRLTARVFYFDHPVTGEAKGKTTLKITAKGIADLGARHGVLPEAIHEALNGAVA